MTQTAAELLAGALEREADAHERGELGDARSRMEAVRREVARFNDIPRPVYKLALRFWKAWAREASFGWGQTASITKDDWPRLARKVAQSVRAGRLPSDPLILQHFVRRGPRLQWREIRRLFGDPETPGSPKDGA